MGVHALRAEHPGPARGHHGQVHGLDEGGGPVIERGVGDLEAAQAGDHRLVLEDRLQDALGHLGLIGGVGGHELRAGGEGLHDSGDLVVIRAGAGKADEVAPAGTVAPGEVLETPGDIRLAHGRGQIEAPRQAQGGRDLAEQLVEVLKAEQGEHLGDLVLGMGDKGRPHGRAPSSGESREGRLDDGRFERAAPHGELDCGPELGPGGQKGEGDAPLQHGREVAARDHPDRLGADEDLVAVAGRPAALQQEAPQAPPGPRLAFALQRRAAPEGALVPADDPAEAGLERGDAGPELVAVEGQARFEAQGVAGPEAGRGDPGRDDSPPEQRGGLCGHGALDAVLACVAGAGHLAGHALELEVGHREMAHGRRLGRDGGEPGARPRSLDGDDGPGAGDVVTAQHRDHPFGVGGVRHDVKALLGDPPDDEVVEHRGVRLLQEVLVLGPARRDAVEVVRQARLQQGERARALDADGAEMADVEHGGVVATRKVLGDRAGGIRERHLPAAEVHEPGAEVDVLGVQSGVFGCHPANLAVASGRYFPSRLNTSRR